MLQALRQKVSILCKKGSTLSSALTNSRVKKGLCHTGEIQQKSNTHTHRNPSFPQLVPSDHPLPRSLHPAQIPTPGSPPLCGHTDNCEPGLSLVRAGWEGPRADVPALALLYTTFPPSRGSSSGRRWSQCRTHCRALASPQPLPKAEPKTRTWVPVAYLGGDSKKHKWGCGERKTGKGEKAIWCAGPTLSFHLCYRGMCLTFLIFPLSCRDPIIGVVANAQRAKRSCPPVWKTISNYPYFLKNCILTARTRTYLQILFEVWATTTPGDGSYSNYMGEGKRAGSKRSKSSWNNLDHFLACQVQKSPTYTIRLQGQIPVCLLR